MSSVVFDGVGRFRAGYRAVLALLLVLVAAVVLATVVEPVPSPFDDAAHQLATAAAVVGIAWVFSRVLDDRPVATYGLAVDGQWLRQLLVGFVLAASVTAGTNAAFVALGWTTVVEVATVGDAGSYLPDPANFAVVSLVFVVGMFGLLWEVLGFYGLVMRNAVEGLGGLVDDRAAIAVGLLSVSGLFGLLHYAAFGGSTAGGVWYALLGIAVGLAYVLTGSLAFPIGFRTGWAIGYAVLVGYAPSPGPRLVAIDLSREALFSGTTGTVLVVAALVALSLVLAWIRLAYGTLGLRVTVRR